MSANTRTIMSSILERTRLQRRVRRRRAIRAAAVMPSMRPIRSRHRPVTARARGCSRPLCTAERIFIGGRGPVLCAYLSLPEAGSAEALQPPLLLVHSVNAAASAAEVRPLFEHHTGSRPVMAIELPGFGSSQRDFGLYTPTLMRDALLRAIAHLKLLGLNRPVDVLAVSLSCEFATLAALEEPSRIRSLALVSPTGLTASTPEHYEDGRTKDKAWLRHLLERGFWADPLFRLLSSETSMRRFLERTWGSRNIDERLLAYNLKSVRQPGARHAPYAFIAGALFTRGVARLYARVQQPVWMAHGRRGDFADHDGLAHLGPPSNWTVDGFDAGAMPYFELPRSFASRYAGFLARVGAPWTPARQEARA